MTSLVRSYGFSLRFSKNFLEYLRITIEPRGALYDTINSIPAKPLPKGTLKCGGFLLLWGQG